MAAWFTVLWWKGDGVDGIAYAGVHALHQRGKALLDVDRLVHQSMTFVQLLLFVESLLRDLCGEDLVSVLLRMNLKHGRGVVFAEQCA